MAKRKAMEQRSQSLKASYFQQATRKHGFGKTLAPFFSSDGIYEVDNGIYIDSNNLFH
jgi:hypothetical protein